MISFTFKDAARAAGGTFRGEPRILEQTVASVVIDSRKVENGSLYIPVIGERFDGHSFIADAYQAGAACVFSDRELSGGGAYILVRDTMSALHSLAAYYRTLSKAKVIGLTGSAGKTTTKELTAAVLKQKYSVLKSTGNLNNQTGVPQTLFSIEEHHEIAVVEMGTNHFGEIAALAKCAAPEIGMFTNIGTAHIEHLGSREGILKAKAEMLEFIPENGLLILNGDDDMLIRLKDRRQTVTYGIGAGNDVYASDIDESALTGVGFTINYKGETTPVHVSSPGRHIILDALAGAAAGFSTGVSAEEIRRGLESFTAPQNRMAVREANGITVLDDVYNANPASMAASIDVLAMAKGRRVCILGDMLELGEKSARFHYDIGAHAKNANIELIICVGQRAKDIAAGAGREAIWFSSQEELIAALGGLITAGDTVLVKASRALLLENTVAALTGEKTTVHE